MFTTETLRTGSCSDRRHVLVCKPLSHHEPPHVLLNSSQLRLLAGGQTSCLKNNYSSYYSASWFVRSSGFHWKSTASVCELTNQSRGRGLKRQDRQSWMIKLMFWTWSLWRRLTCQMSLITSCSVQMFLIVYCFLPIQSRSVPTTSELIRLKMSFNNLRD